jgi:hypothetical protein
MRIHSRCSLCECDDDILFLLPKVAFPQVPSCRALAAAVVALQRLVPWAA